MHRSKNFSPCGDRDLGPRRPKNFPGRSEITYRIGTQPEILERMLWRIPRFRVKDPDTDLTTLPLARLRTDLLDDPTIGLVDAFACALDVVTFYSERIANGGYLGTTNERRSMVELARMVGYELAPGVAASTYLAFSVEAADDPFRRVAVPIGVQAMSIPQAKGELPQVFETTEEITARAEWNDIHTRTQRNQHLALFQKSGDAMDGTIYLFDLDNSFDDAVQDDLNLVEITDESGLGQFHPLDRDLDLSTALARRISDKDSNPEIEPLLRALPVDEIHFQGLGRGLSPGTRMLAVAQTGDDGTVYAQPLRVVNVSEDQDFQVTTLVLTKNGKPPEKTRRAPVFRSPRYKIGTIPVDSMQLGTATLDQHIRGNSWTGGGLSVFVRRQEWSRVKLMSMLRQKKSAATANLAGNNVEPGFHAMTEDTAFFGATAPDWDTISFGQKDDGKPKKKPYVKPWDNPKTTIWTDCQKVNHAGDATVFIDREVKTIQPNSWMVLETSSGSALGFRVTAAATQSRADYAQSAKVTGLKLADAAGNLVIAPDPAIANDLNGFYNRTSHAFISSKYTPLAGIPLEREVAAGQTALDLDTLYLDLERERPVSLSGSRLDAEGIDGSETVLIDEVLHIDGITRLLLSEELSNSYDRTTLRLNANVALATHGERVEEVLGSGDATSANQTFSLKKPLLTYVAAATPTGRVSTLSIRVDSILWHEVTTLRDAGPDDAAFDVRHGENDEVVIRFGDGENGRRLPSGELNVIAVYRTGTGIAGNVPERVITQLRTRPLGIRAVTNPSPALGSAEPESLESARETVPNTLKTLGRIVSIKDYEDFARNFAGIGKAQATQLWSGRNKVAHVTVSPDGDSELTGNAPVMIALSEAVENLRDNAKAVVLQPYVRRYFQLSTKIFVSRDYLLSDVETASHQALDSHFCFDRRSLGQPVTAAEVISILHSVSGITSVDLDALAHIEDGSLVRVGDVPLDAVLTANVATGPGKLGTGEFAPAELLILLPSAVSLTMEFADV